MKKILNCLILALLVSSANSLRACNGSKLLGSSAIFASVYSLLLAKEAYNNSNGHVDANSAIGDLNAQIRNSSILSGKWGQALKKYLLTASLTTASAVLYYSGRSALVQ